MKNFLIVSIVCSSLLADTKVLDSSLATFDSMFDSRKVIDKITRVKAEQSYENYRAMIEHYARVNSVEKSLIAAIIKVESNFDKNAVSSTNALGLMQVKLDQAVSDVYKSNFGRNDIPKKEQLFEAQFNISIGSQYIKLMSNKYFKEIKDKKSREYCLIAGYNAGAGTVLRTFHEDKLIAQGIINNLSADEVLGKLTKDMASEQGRRYIQKVLIAKEEFEKNQMNFENSLVYVNSIFEEVKNR